MAGKCSGAAARLLGVLSLLLAAASGAATAGSVLLASAGAPQAAVAQTLATAHTSADTAHCVDSRSLDLRRILPAPPRAGSARERAELDELLRIQARRTPSESDLARRDAEKSVFRFADALGDAPGFEAARLPRTLALLRHLDVDEAAVVGPAKREFARPRPFAVEPRLDPIVARPLSGSYPSGHSTWAYTTALVLADMLPERREQLLTRADQYARNRTVAGVHYPSDVEAGRLVGTTLAAMLFTCPAFEREEAGARRELRAALHLP